MGVRGLTSYLEKSVQFYGTKIELRDTKLIIDGHNLCNYLYQKIDLDCRCGGQYEEFYKKVQLFFDALKSKGVESFVVLDGAYDRSDKKLETQIKRTQDRIEKADGLFKNETSADDNERFLLPLLAKFVFVEVLRDHLIKFAVSDCEADSDIASLAKDWEWPVLSNDSDFFIFDVKGGFIPLSSFDVDQLTTRIFYRSDLAKNLGIREELLPLFASLVGNDYVSWGALEPFNRTICTSSSDGRSRKEARFYDVASFLSQLPNTTTETQAFESALGRIEPVESRERLEKAVEYSLQEYAITKSNLLDYLRNGVVCSLLRTQSNLELDEEVLCRFREGEFSTDSMSSLTAGKVFLRVQVEDLESRSSNQCSMALRQLMYGILSDGGRNMNMIEEWDREGFAVKHTDIKPYNDKVPSFSSIPKLDPHVRLRMFLDALDSDSAYIKSLPEDLALVASSLRFLHRNSQPSLETSHLRALVCSCVKLEDGSWKQYRVHSTRAVFQPFDKKAAQSFCQWQCVLRDAIHLNFVLHKPVQTPCIRKTFNGKLVHRLQRELKKGREPESLMSNASSRVRYHELYTAITADPEEKGIDPQSCPHLPKEIHVRRFIHFFHQHVTDQNHDYIRFIYETNFNKLTEIYFEESPWPKPDYVASLVDGDQVFLILYKELYYRHIYHKLKPTLEDRFESYFNYCDLFNYILNTDEPVPLSLPSQWLWDIIDEFINQFQAFRQYRLKLLKKGGDEVGTLRANTKIWNVHSVLNVLHSLAEKSKINQQLARYNQGGDPDSVAGVFGIHPLYKMLGYFSLIGLLQLHLQLGDFVQAFKVLEKVEKVELNKKSLYSSVPACQITTYYYVGFAYLMMKRYQDAIRSFSNILLYIQSIKNKFQTKSYQYEQIMKKNDQMYVLLAICLSLYPQRIDEYVHSQLREKNADRLQQLQHGDLQTFEESFSYACPKFIFPVPPNFDAPPANFNGINGSHETEPDYVASLVDGDQVFLILYKELYYRHIYHKLKPTLEHRFESYFNYCDLFNYILNTDEPVPLSLPNQWLWDIIDEFIYQFQAFSQYRSKLLKKGEDEVETLRANTKIWNVHSVLNVLHSLVEKSKINQQLARYNQGGDPDSVAGEFGIHPLYKMLGYFSLIGLLRLHSQLGDYVQAFKVLENIELNKKSLYSNVPACQITTYYYVGFVYLMMKRYQDAICSFSNILLYIQSTKNMFQTKSYQYEQIMKKNDQMYVLLAICLTLYPQRIDEHVQSQLREKNADRLQRLQHGNLQTFEESFSYACPKFISPVPPNFDAPPANFNMEPFNLQLKVFMNEVLQQSPIPVIRSYLKLYTTMPIAKLAAFLDMDESQIRTQLLCFKHKQRNLVWTKGTDALQGELQSSSEVDFYIDQDMIHIADTKVERRYGDFLITQIHKFEEVTRKIQAFSNT